MAWKIFDLCDAEGNNLIDEWLRSLPNGDWRARIALKLHAIKTFDGVELPNMVTPTPGQSHIKEIVIKAKQLSPRVFLCRGPDSEHMRSEITLLGGGREQDSKYSKKRPHITPAMAEERRLSLMEDIDGRRKAHEFPEDVVE